MITDYNSFWKIHCFTFLPYKSRRVQTWRCRKIGQDQPRVIIWINLVELEYPMLHTKFQGHQRFGSRRRIFKVFTIYGHGGHICHVTWTIWTIYIPPFQGGGGPHIVWLQSAEQFLRKWNLNMLNLSDQGQWMTLTFDIHIGSCTHLDNCIYQLWHHRLQ